MKNFLHFIFSMTCLQATAQDSTTRPIQVENFVVPIFDTVSQYVQIEERVSFRYPTRKYENRNVRITYEEPIFIITHTDDSGKVLIKFENRPIIQDHSTWLVADSVKLQELDSTVLGDDKTWPNPIITQSIQLQKSGNYWEYYPNGSLKIQGSYKFDRKWGSWKYYAENGELVRTELWENGLLKTE